MRIAARLGMPASTAYAVLQRLQLHRLDCLDRPTGQTIRRYERPGELEHIDTKKLVRIPPGGGHKILGRDAAPHEGDAGYEYVHSTVDDHSRLAYSEIHSDERAETCAVFLRRAVAFYAAHCI